MPFSIEPGRDYSSISPGLKERGTHRGDGCQPDLTVRPARAFGPRAMKSEPDPQMTFGAANAAGMRLIVRCRIV